VKICAGCVVFALALRVVLTVLDRPTAAYVLTPTRLDALAIGALLAVLVRRPGPFPVARLAVRIALAASVLAIAAMFVAQRSLWPETPAVATLGQSVIALAGGSLLAEILLGSGRWRLARLFEHPVLRFVGRYSYGIYVLHHPLIIALGQSELAASEWPRWRGTQVPGLLIASTIAFALSLGAALLSWHALESPFLRMKRFFPYGSDPRVAR
jgi:peptidoglycan/LPS O-acetylase OafA/YrhL